MTMPRSISRVRRVRVSVSVGMIADSAGLGLEMFHLDAGWFRGVGDWYPNPKNFPHGLTPLADDAHRRGMKFGLWVDWAQAVEVLKDLLFSPVIGFLLAALLLLLMKVVVRSKALYVAPEGTTPPPGPIGPFSY